MSNRPYSARRYIVNGVPVEDTRNQQGADEIVHRLHVNRSFSDAVREEREARRTTRDAAVYDEQGVIADRNPKAPRWFRWAVGLLVAGAAIAALAS